MSAKKKTNAEAPEVKAPAKVSDKVIERKINKDEIIQLQKDGKLVGYDPATGIGTVREVGLPTRWPGGNPKVE